MAGKYLTDMAAVLRAAGCQVEEVAGWEARARGSGGYADGRPWCIMWHHTASRIGTSALSNVAYIVKGSPVAPVSNLYLHPNGVYYVCAAGATNTNGIGGPTPVSKGTIPVNQMNTHAISIEAGNDGVGQPWPQAQIDAYFRGSNALAAAYGLKPSDICSHNAYTPGRKIDPAVAGVVIGPWKPRSVNSSGSWSVEDMRTEATKRAGGTPTPPKPQPIPPPKPPLSEDEVQLVEIAVVGRNARFLGYLIKPTTTAADGTKVREFILWAEWVNGADPIQTNRLQAYRNMGIPVYSVGEMTGIGLLGPIPTGDTLHNWVREDFGNLL